MLCLDEMGPVAAKSYAGQQLIRLPGPAAPAQPAGRARQEADYGRRESGYVYGAFRPATGDCLTGCYAGRTSAHFVDFLAAVEAWVPAEVATIYVIMDNLSTHKTADVLLFSAAHPRWAFVFQPVYAAYLNLIEPWWKVLRALALKGRRFASWAEVSTAIAAATAYWNVHKHPFVWGHRRRHRLTGHLRTSQSKVA